MVLVCIPLPWLLAHHLSQLKGPYSTMHFLKTIMAVSLGNFLDFVGHSKDSLIKILKFECVYEPLGEADSNVDSQACGDSNSEGPGWGPGVSFFNKFCIHPLYAASQPCSLHQHP